MNCRVFGIVALVACAGLPGWTSAADAEAGADTPRLADNVRIVIAVGEMQSGGTLVSRSHELIVQNNTKARLTTGWRIPIPVTTFNTANTSEGAIAPVTSYTYQNVGLTAQLQARIVGARILLSGSIELSEVDAPEPTTGGTTPQPTIGTFAHDFEVALRPGTAEKVATVTKPSGGTLQLEITAERAD